MRILELSILNGWKNLQDFTRIEFDRTRNVSVLIGRNGSAKSNLLEAIITIFRNIDLREPAAFSYRIKYEIHSKDVEVTAEAGKNPHARVEGKPVPLSVLRAQWSPAYVVGYYSGVSDRFEELFHKHDLLARNQTLSGSKTATPTGLELRRFISARPLHGLFALLAFYFSDDEIAVEFLRELPKVVGFDSALIVAHKPMWAKSSSSAEQFWGALGPVRQLLERVRSYSLAPFNRVATIRKDFARRERRELAYLYLPDIHALHALADEYDRDPRFLFQALDTMRLSDLIEDFRVRVRVMGSAGAIHTRQLSEGEQQLLTVLGLMRFTQRKESLYILDEPDTHLNPAWGLEYLDRLRRVGGLSNHSHTIIATHDPLLVAGLCREEIRILRRREDGKISADTPEESPRGRGVASVLTSSLYGLESQLDSFSLRVLKRIYDITYEPPSDSRNRHLRRLRRLIPALETSEQSPDPFRNIAREAFQVAQEQALRGPEPTNRKAAIVERLSQQLYEEAKGPGE